jgi:uncharacterized protein
MNKVVHFEIPFDDDKRAEKFYKDVFGWQINKFPGMDYYLAITADSEPNQMTPKEPGAINGGLLKRDDTGKAPMIVIDVPSIDEHISKITDAGGKQVMPKVPVGDFGFYARVSDTEGNVIGLWQTAK